MSEGIREQTDIKRNKVRTSKGGLDAFDGEKLPRITNALPRLRIDVFKLLAKADNRRDLTTYNSDVKGMGYVATDEDVLVMNGTGFIRLRKDQLTSVIYELENILEDMTTWLRQ